MGKAMRGACDRGGLQRKSCWCPRRERDLLTRFDSFHRAPAVKGRRLKKIDGGGTYMDKGIASSRSTVFGAPFPTKVV